MARLWMINMMIYLLKMLIYLYITMSWCKVFQKNQQNLNSHSPDLLVKVTALSAEDISRHRKKLTRHPTQLRRTSREKKCWIRLIAAVAVYLDPWIFRKKQKASCSKNNWQSQTQKWIAKRAFIIQIFGRYYLGQTDPNNQAKNQAIQE